MAVDEIPAERMPTAATLLRPALAALREPRAVQAVADELLARQLSVTRATAGVVLMLTEDGGALELVASCGYDAADLAGWERSPVDLDFPLHEAVRHDRVVVVASLGELAERYPQARPFDPRPHALAAFPLRGASGEVLGAAGLRFDEAMGEDLGEDVLAGEMLSLVAGGQIERTRLVESLQERVVQLQSALDSRVVIEQAKGVLAERYGIAPTRPSSG